MTSPDVKFLPPDNKNGVHKWEIEFAMSANYLVCTEHSRRPQHFRFSIKLEPMPGDRKYYVECKEYIFLYWKEHFRMTTKSYDLATAIKEALNRFDDYLMAEKSTKLPLDYFETSMFLKMEVLKIVSKMITFPSIRAYVGEMIDPTLTNRVEKKCYPSGKLKSETQYVNDKKHGIQKEYYETGELESETSYLNGKEHGITKQYFYHKTEGEYQGHSEHTFVEGKGVGNLTVYDKNGKLSSEIPMEFSYNGKEGREQKWGTNGVEKTYFESGKLKSEIPIVYSKKHGVAKFYNESGNLEKTIEYLNDVAS